MRTFTCCLILLIYLFSFPLMVQGQNISGAWAARQNGITHVMLVADDYLSLTAYNEGGHKFLYTLGGPMEVKEGQWEVSCEFDTMDSSSVGTHLLFPMHLSKDVLTLGKASINKLELPSTWSQVDKGRSGLAGNWQITQRMQDGKLQVIHQSGTRKTVKLLTGSRFQWVAIDPGIKGFYGTGGGTYIFNDGKYTEHIEFFSRDSSRVGASLSFIGKLINGDWHHSGKSSRGDDIYEVWSRKKGVK